MFGLHHSVVLFGFGQLSCWKTETLDIFCLLKHSFPLFLWVMYLCICHYFIFYNMISHIANGFENDLNKRCLCERKCNVVWKHHVPLRLKECKDSYSLHPKGKQAAQKEHF